MLFARSMTKLRTFKVIAHSGQSVVKPVVRPLHRPMHVIIDPKTKNNIKQQQISIKLVPIGQFGFLHFMNENICKCPYVVPLCLLCFAQFRMT